MKQYNTFAETEALLRTTINLRSETIKQIAAITGIRADTLYKWKTTNVHSSLLVNIESPHCSAVGKYDIPFSF